MGTKEDTTIGMKPARYPTGTPFLEAQQASEVELVLDMAEVILI
jgi:hypothetical protein